MFNKISLLAATAVICAASTIPVESPDGTTVTGPGIGRAVIPLAGETWMVCGNDNWSGAGWTGGGDNDFNEPCGKATFAADTFTFELMFSVSAYFNTLGVQDQSGGINLLNPLASFTYIPGEEVIFDLFVRELNVHLLSGDGSRNLDGIPYVWAQQIGTPDERSTEETPETSSLLMLGTGLAIIAASKARHALAPWGETNS